MRINSALLIVSDESQRTLLESYLRTLNIHVLSCNGVEDALTKTRNVPVDISIFSATLLQKDGLAPFYRLKASLPEIFTILLTNESYLSNDADILKEGIDSYLFTPLNEISIKATLLQASSILRLRDDLRREVSELRQKRRFYENLLNCFEDAVAVINPNFEIIYFNAAFEELMQLPGDTLQLSNLQEYIDDGFKVLNYIQKQLDTGKNVRYYQIALKAPNNELLDINIDADLLGRMPDNRNDIIIVMENHTLSRDNFTHLLRKEKINTIKLLAKALAHEVHNPINILSGRVQLLIQKLDDSQYHKSFDAINRQLDRVAEIIDKLRRFNINKEDSIPQSLALVPILESFLNEKDTCQDVSYKLHYKVNEKALMIDANQSQLQDAFDYLFRIIENIVSPGTRIHVYCRKLKSFSQQKILEIQVNFKDTQTNGDFLQTIHDILPHEKHSLLDIALVHTIISNYDGKMFIETLVGDQKTLKLHFKISGVKTNTVVHKMALQNIT